MACGTSFNAGLWGARLLERFGGVPVAVEIASEFRYRDPLLEEGEAVLAISQSGETADTLAALRLAREKGCVTLGLCNVVGLPSRARRMPCCIPRPGRKSAWPPPRPCAVRWRYCCCSPCTGEDAEGGKGSRAAWPILRALPALLDGELPSMRETAARIARA